MEKVRDNDGRWDDGYGSTYEARVVIGTYANKVELQVENILPFAFPFGIGGPKMNRRVKVSLELCIQLYF